MSLAVIVMPAVVAIPLLLLVFDVGARRGAGVAPAPARAPKPAPAAPAAPVAIAAPVVEAKPRPAAIRPGEGMVYRRTARPSEA